MSRGRTMNADPTSVPIDEKRAILEEVLRRRAAESIRAPLSAGQERLWRLLSREPGSPVYNLGFLYFLRGPLDVGCLERAVASASRRHESLRTAFAVIDGVPMQVISPFEGPVLERRELAPAADADFEAESRRIAEQVARAPIDLTRSPLWRFLLLEHSATERSLLILSHHIVSDRWSVGLLVQELAAEYRALRGEGASSAARSVISYREATRSLEAATPEAEAERQLAYWDRRFAGEVSNVALRTDLRAVGEVSYRGMRRTFDLPVGLSAGVRAIAAEEETTVYVVAVASLAAHLHRESGQSDLVFVSPVSGRHHAATRGVIGYFNNLLPIRLELPSRATFRDAIAAAAEAVRGAFENQDVPFQRIAERPGLARVRLGRCLIAFQNTTSMDLDLPDIRSNYEDVATDTANFDLGLVLEERRDSYRAWFDARADLWSPASFERFIGEFLETLEAVVAAPDLALHEPGRAVADPSSPTAPRSIPAAGPGTSPVPRDDRTRNELERRIIGIWEEVLGLRSLTPESHFFELGGNSLMAARIFDRIGQAVGREVPLAALLRASTIRQLSELILEEGDAPCWASLVPIRPGGDRVPLFCVHGGGGGVLSYTRIAEQLGPDRPLWGLQARRWQGEGPSPRVEEMAGEYLRAILSVHPDGPYHLCGHSFGGLVAFEIARQLTESGRPVGLLAVIDFPGPDARVTRLEKLRWFFYSLSQLDRRHLAPYILDRVRSRIRSRPPLYRALTRLSRLFGGEGDASKTEHRLKTMSETMTAMALYRPGFYPGRLTLFRARGGDAAINADRLGGWGGTARGGVEVHDFPCDHMAVFQEPHCRVVGQALRDGLERAEQAACPAVRPPEY